MRATDERFLTGSSASDLANMVGRGEVSAVEVVGAHLEQIERVNTKLNAVVLKRFEAALEEARSADERRSRSEAVGPLNGVPISVKECLNLVGTPSTFGIPSLRQNIATADELHVARLRAAGGIVVGKTNLSQALLYCESDNPLFGRTNNPWNLDRSCGGSSGGEAAIISAGGSCLGLGTDIGGSVRIPAAFCGITSLKPTAGRIPDPGRYSIPFGQQAIPSQIGVLARHVADVDLGLRIVNGGYNPATEPPMPLGDLTQVDVSQLRVGYYLDDGTFAAAPGVRRAVQEAANILANRGAQVSVWSPPDIPEAIQIFYNVLSADGGRGLRGIISRNPVDPRIKALLFAAGRSRAALNVIGGLLELFGQRGLSAALEGFGHDDTFHYWRAVEAQIAYCERFLTLFKNEDSEPLDVLLSAPYPLPAITHGASLDLGQAGGYTILSNVLGFPSGVVPLTRVRKDEQVGRIQSRDRVANTAYHVERDSVGLPLGVQVMARPWREHVALAAMWAIEQEARKGADFPGRPSD